MPNALPAWNWPQDIQVPKTDLAQVCHKCRSEKSGWNKQSLYPGLSNKFKGKERKIKTSFPELPFFLKAWCPRRGGWGRGRGQGGESLHPQRWAEELMWRVTCAQLILCLPLANINTHVFADILEGRVNSATMAEIPVNIPCELPQGAAFPSES